MILLSLEHTAHLLPLGASLHLAAPQALWPFQTPKQENCASGIPTKSQRELVNRESTLMSNRSIIRGNGTAPAAAKPARVENVALAIAIRIAIAIRSYLSSTKRPFIFETLFI